MFKINKLDNIKNEKVNINYINYETYNIKDKKSDSYKTLSFNIEGNIGKDVYSFNFDLNCRLEELLKIEDSKPIDFKKYVFDSEVYLTINGIAYLDPVYYITVCKYLNNKFIVDIDFYSEFISNKSDIYSGMIEFEFDLDNYL